MARLIWTEPALLDLDAIAEYIALDDLCAAQGFVEKVFERTARLERFPGSGRRPPELQKTPYQEIVVAPCRIFYRREGDAVYIIYVMRSEKLLREHLLALRDTDK